MVIIVTSPTREEAALEALTEYALVKN